MDRSRRIISVLLVWFILQVVLNLATVVFLIVSPPPEPVLPSEWADAAVNTLANALIAAGLHRRRRWAWKLAVLFLPLYWAWNLPVLASPRADLELGMFLLIDALVLAVFNSHAVRGPLKVPADRWRFPAVAAPVLGLLAVFVLLRVPLGGDAAAVMVILAVLILLGQRARRRKRAGG